MKRRKRSSSEKSDLGKSGTEKLHISSIQDLTASLRAQRREVVGARGIGVEAWTECVELAREELNEGKEAGQRIGNRQWVLRSFCLFCSYAVKGLVVAFLLLLCIGLLLYLCRPASFYLQRKLHSRVYTIARLLRKGLLTVNPYLNTVGLDLLSSCVLENPFLHNYQHCPTAQDIKVWSSSGSTVPVHIIEDVQSGDWWVIRDAFEIEEEVTMERLHQFSVDGSRILPRTCAEIVGGGEGSKATAFYTDVFDIERMKEALKSPTPWSLSWLECPNEDNPLTLHSLLPPPSHLPPDVRTSTMSLFSLSTEWCINYHYQGELPSSLLSVMVVRGEVRVVPVVESEHCEDATQGLWDNSLFLKEGDAVLLDHRYWSYEVQTWSNYSITVTVSLLDYDSSET